MLSQRPFRYHFSYQQAIEGSSSTSATEQPSSSAARLSIQSSSDQERWIDEKKHHQVIKSDIKLGEEYEITFQLAHFTRLAKINKLLHTFKLNKILPFYLLLVWLLGTSTLGR